MNSYVQCVASSYVFLLFKSELFTQALKVRSSSGSLLTFGSVCLIQMTAAPLGTTLLGTALN